MLVKLGYKSIDENGGRRAKSGKKVINRLRLMNFFVKKEGDAHADKKPDSDETQSISETTAELSPVKSEESESYDEKFDLYSASSYLPHMSVNHKDDLDVLVEKPSIHYQAFTEASGMKVPPPTPQKVRTRRRTPISKGESGSVIRPTNLSHYFSQNTNPQRPSTTINKTKQQILSFGNDLIEAVEHSNSDFNLMLERMSSEKKSTIKLKSRLSKQDAPEPKKIENPAEPIVASNNKKSTVPKTMDDIKGYISQLRAGAATSSESNDSYKKYQQLFKSKLGSIGKILSSVTPDVTQASSSCEANMCNFMEVAEELMNPTLNQSGYVSSTPLDQSWLEFDDDSDSVSKLTMPFNHSELSMSMLSEVASGADKSATRTTVVSYDWE